MSLLTQDDRPIVFKLVRRKASPALTGRHYPGIKRIASEETIYRNKKSIVIRYAEGEQSIYKEDQPLKIKLTDIIFSNGYLVVEQSNPLLIEYLQYSNHNSSNPERITSKTAYFEEVNASKEAEIKISDIELENKAISYIFSMEINELKGYARVLGMDVSNTVNEIKHDMIQYAKKKPNEFLAGIDNPVVKVQESILDGIELSIVSQDRRSLYWNLGEGKTGLIVTAPIGKKIVEYAAEWMLADKDGEKVYKEIKKKIDVLMDS